MTIENLYKFHKGHSNRWYAAVGCFVALLALGSWLAEFCVMNPDCNAKVLKWLGWL